VFNNPTCTDTTPGVSSTCPISKSFIYKHSDETSLCVSDCAEFSITNYYKNDISNTVCSNSCPPERDLTKMFFDGDECIEQCSPNFHLNFICRLNCSGITETRVSENGECLDQCSDHSTSIYQAETGLNCLTSCPTLRYESDPKRCATTCDYHKDSICYESSCPDANDIQAGDNECV
jgi:hypothetical protein